MSKIRIYELAKELSKSNKEVQDAATKLGLEIKSHMSTLEDDEVTKLRSNFKPKSASDQVQEKPAEKHHKIIYDRTKEIKEEENKKHTKSYSSDTRNKSYDNRSNNRPSDTRPAENRSTSASAPGDQKTTDNRSSDNRPRTNDNRSRTYDNRPGDQRTGGYNQNRSYDNRNNDNRTTTSRPTSDRPASDRPASDRPASDRPAGDNRTYNSNRSYDNRNNANRTGDSRTGDSRAGDSRTGDQRTGGYNQNRSYDNRSPRPAGDRPAGDRPAGDNQNRSYDNRSPRPTGDRPAGNRSYDNRSPRPAGDRPAGDRPAGNRSYDNRSPRPAGDRPAGDRPSGNRTYDNRTSSGGTGTREGGYKPREGGYKPREGGYKPREGGSSTGGSSNRGPSNYQNRDGRGPNKKVDSSIKSITSEIQEKTPKKKKPKKDKIVVTFDQDKLENKSKKAKKLLKEEISVKEVDTRRNFNFGKKTKQKKVKYKQQFEKEKTEKLDEKLAKEILQVEIPITVKDFAERINKGFNEVIVKLMELGTMATINQELDFEIAELLALEYNIELEQLVVEEEDLVELFELDSEDRPEDMVKRAPVVTVMGHVDHGKTSLLDAIRDTGVADGEAGGITQHIGASEIVHKGEKIVFLDTPGHEAFTSLRARGAKVTDIAILVVAADDGVMPQTIEAIDHSKAANVPIIVAINKIDKPNANPDRVKQELADRGVLIEEWGGDVIAVPVSAKTGEGLDKLLEMVLLVAEVLELKANPNRLGVGSVIEAKVVKGRGTVTTIILEKGQMCVGDPIVAGASAGKIKAMYNDKGKKVKKIGPSTTVEIDGLSDIPQAGDKIFVTPDERTAKLFADRNAIQVREKSLSKNSGLTLEELFEKIQQGEIKDLNIIVKADVHGSVEAIKQSLLKIKNEEVRVNILHASVGAISESDVALASASSAIIIGFNVRPSANVSYIADQEGVNIRTYSIIYDAINDVETAMKGMLKPTFKEVVLGRIQVRATFKVPNIGTIAGGYVTTGKVTRNAQVRLIREGIVIFEGKISSLKRFKDDAKEVNTGYECGIGLEKYDDLKENDEIEAFIMEEVKRDL